MKGGKTQNHVASNFHTDTFYTCLQPVNSGSYENYTKIDAHNHDACRILNTTEQNKFLHKGSLRSFSLLVPTSIITGSTYWVKNGDKDINKNHPRKKVEIFLSFVD